MIDVLSDHGLRSSQIFGVDSKAFDILDFRQNSANPIDTNFAFSGLPETNLETGNGAAGNFVGFSRPTADIGGLKIFAAGAKGFSLDDLTLGGAVTTPIPTTAPVR